MRNLYTLLTAIIITTSVFAQAPEKMSYQAVVRDASNALVATQAVGMQISILQGGATGTPVYVETQTPITNANGLVSLEIGTGTLVSGDFTTIDWSAGPYFIMTETDPTGGTSYTITGTSQLMSVPYALHANTAENVINDLVDDADADPANEIQTLALSGSDLTISGGNTITFDTTFDTTDKFYLGQDTLGGIVYYIYKDATGTQHGLIVNKNESTAVWQAPSTSLTNADRTEDGAYNTGLMTSSAAATYVTGLGAGWYLPSIDELALLYYNRFSANKALRAGGFTLLGYDAFYWSSLEYITSSTTSTGAFYFNFIFGY